MGRVVGTLVKYNRKTVNVVSDDGRHYRLSPGLLPEIEDVDSAPPQSKRQKKKNDFTESGRVNSGLE